MSNLAQRRLEALQKQLLLENLQSNVGHPNKELIKVVKTTDAKEKSDDETQKGATTKVGTACNQSKALSSRLQLKGTSHESIHKGDKNTSKEKEKTSLTRLFKIKKDSSKCEKILKDVNSKVGGDKLTKAEPKKSSKKNLSKKKSMSPKNEKTKKHEKNVADPDTKQTLKVATKSTVMNAKEKRKSLLLKLVERRAKSKDIKSKSTALQNKSSKLKQNATTNDLSKIKKTFAYAKPTKTPALKAIIKQNEDALKKFENVELEKSNSKKLKDYGTEQGSGSKKLFQSPVCATAVIDGENSKSEKMPSSSITNFKIPKVSSTIISSSQEAKTKEDSLESKSEIQTPPAENFEMPKLATVHAGPSEAVPKWGAKAFQFSSVTNRLTKTLDSIISFFSESNEMKNVQKTLDHTPETRESTVPSEAFQSSSSTTKPFQFLKSFDSHVMSLTATAKPDSSGLEIKEIQSLETLPSVQNISQLPFELPKSINTGAFEAVHSSNSSANLPPFKAPDISKTGLTKTIKNTFETLRAGRSEKCEFLKTVDNPNENFKFSFESVHPKGENKCSETTKIEVSLDDSVMVDCSKRIKLADNEFTSTYQTQYADTYPRRKNTANQRLKQIREKLEEENIEAGISTRPPSFGNLCHDPDTSSGSKSFNSSQSYSLQASESTSELESDEPMDIDEPMEIDDTEVTPDCVNSLGYNLMKLTEKKSSSLRISAKNKFCIVLDTNVLLKDLVFIQRITSIEFPAFGKPIVIVPYCVLQELDSLKQPRLGAQKNLSVFARNAIRYINEALTKDPPEVKGQSGTEDREHLIFIKSADDCIINCCLQITDVCKRLILISYDKNLVNKAIFNQISSCSPLELMSSVDNT